MRRRRWRWHIIPPARWRKLKGGRTRHGCSAVNCITGKVRKCKRRFEHVDAPLAKRTRPSPIAALVTLHGRGVICLEQPQLAPSTQLFSLGRPRPSVGISIRREPVHKVSLGDKPAVGTWFDVLQRDALLPLGDAGAAVSRALALRVRDNGSKASHTPVLGLPSRANEALGRVVDDKFDARVGWISDGIPC